MSVNQDRAAVADVSEKGHDIYLDQTEDEPPALAQRDLVRRQDLRIVPLSAGIYLLCYLDRSNIGMITDYNGLSIADMFEATQRHSMPTRNMTCFRKLTCCLLYTSPSPRDGLLSRMPSSA